MNFNLKKQIKTNKNEEPENKFNYLMDKALNGISGYSALTDPVEIEYSNNSFLSDNNRAMNLEEMNTQYRNQVFHTFSENIENTILKDSSDSRINNKNNDSNYIRGYDGNQEYSVYKKNKTDPLQIKDKNNLINKSSKEELKILIQECKKELSTSKEKIDNSLINHNTSSKFVERDKILKEIIDNNHLFKSTSSLFEKEKDQENETINNSKLYNKKTIKMNNSNSNLNSNTNLGVENVLSKDSIYFEQNLKTISDTSRQVNKQNIKKENFENYEDDNVKSLALKKVLNELKFDNAKIKNEDFSPVREIFNSKTFTSNDIFNTKNSKDFEEKKRNFIAKNKDNLIADREIDNFTYVDVKSDLINLQNKLLNLEKKLESTNNSRNNSKNKTNTSISVNSKRNKHDSRKNNVSNLSYYSNNSNKKKDYKHTRSVKSEKSIKSLKENKINLILQNKEKSMHKNLYNNKYIVNLSADSDCLDKDEIEKELDLNIIENNIWSKSSKRKNKIDNYIKLKDSENKSLHKTGYLDQFSKKRSVNKNLVPSKNSVSSNCKINKIENEILNKQNKIGLSNKIKSKIENNKTRQNGNGLEPNRNNIKSKDIKNLKIINNKENHRNKENSRLLEIKNDEKLKQANNQINSLKNELREEKNKNREIQKKLDKYNKKIELFDTLLKNLKEAEKSFIELEKNYSQCEVIRNEQANVIKSLEKDLMLYKLSK